MEFIEKPVVEVLDFLVRHIEQFIEGETPHPDVPAPAPEEMIPRDPQPQFDLLRSLGWAKEDQIAQLASSMPAYPETNKLVARVVVPHFAPKDGFTGFQITLREVFRLVGIMHMPKGTHQEYVLPSQLNAANLSGYAPVSDVEYTPGLRWELIELDGNLEKTAADVRLAGPAPELGIYAAALYYPKWVRNLGRKGAPWVLAAGVNRVINDGGVERDYVTTLESRLERPDLDCRRADLRFDDFAVPCFYKAE